MSGGGECYRIDQTRKIVQEFADKEAVKKGKVPSYDGGPMVSNKTVKIYHEEISTHPEIILRKQVSTKDEGRIAAEDSLQSVTSFLLTIAATHFIEGAAPDGHPCLTKKGTSDAQSFFELIKKSHKKKNIEVIPCSPFTDCK